MSALESSPTLRWERRENDEKEMPASEQRVYRQQVGKLFWIDRADLRCAMGKASSSLGRASDTDMRNIKSISRPLHRNPGIITVRPTTLNLEAVKRAPVGSVLTFGDSDWAGDADRFSVSGTASWLRGKLGWYPTTASSRKKSTIALSNGEAVLHSLEAWACDNSGKGAMPRRRMRRHNRSCAVIPLQRWV